MDQDRVKGVITNCEYETKYYSDGVSYKDYVLYVGNKRYTTQVKEKIYLEKDMLVIMQLEPGTTNEVASGYCIREDYKWGENAKDLKRSLPQNEKYEFMEGTVTEKRKSTTGSIYMNRSAMSNRGSKISYTIILEKNEFHATVDEGEYLQVGMNIALVLEQKMPVLILNKDTGKILNLAKPYFILFLLAIILFNGYMYFGDKSIFPNYKTVLIVINVFLVLAFLLSIVIYAKSRSAKRFLDSKLNEN